jgi:dipeptidyl aminopeptidase/acylaminoacyl peptidase
MKVKRLSGFLLCIIATSFLCNETIAQNAAWQPTHTEVVERYKKALVTDSLGRNSVFKTNVRANWQPGGKAFWYMNLLQDSKEEYILVDVPKASKKLAFDHSKLAAGLKAAGVDSISADKLRITDMRFAPNGKTVTLQTKRKWWYCNLADYKCTLAAAPTPDTTKYPGFTTHRARWWSFRTDSISPDKKWSAYIKNGNLIAQSTADSTQKIAFTTDGTEAKPYSSIAWSPDSKYIVAYHENPVKDTPVYFVRTSLPGTTRGKVDSNEYKQPGDAFSTFEMYSFAIDSKKAQKINTPIIDFFEAPTLHWTSLDARYFLYEKVDRGHQRFRIIEVDALTGNTRTVLDEQTKTFIYEQRIYTHYLPETQEIVWVSEKDGWRHLYMVNAANGIARPITKGNWVVRDVDSIDANKKEIWFRASGMNAGEDPYNVHYYRIGFNGENLVQLTPTIGNHRLTFSQDKKFFLDTYSQVNVAPITALFNTISTKKIMDIEAADTSLWASRGFKAPEVFVAKGRDGVTDIWGLVCKPSNFDPTKKYPIIENIYAGPQDAFVPKLFMPYGEMQSIAELGFIVVQIDGMGTANRSKAFHDVCWQNLADAGFPDRILWMKALAAKYPYADDSRVGLYGTSAGGQNSLGGLLFHPEFYKAAVSSCGCHDNRVDKQWWNEQWMGYPVGKHYEQQSNVTNASKLKGKLLLMVGEEDSNVPPESTFRVADALIKARKNFELLTLPGFGHTAGGPYGDMRRKDFFVKSLLGVEPPDRNMDELTAD